MTKKKRKAFNAALQSFDEGLAKMDGALDTILAVSTAEDGPGDEEEEETEFELDIMAGEDNYLH